ncbi:MAG TPA: hypothetical protein DEA44_17285 [Firmicutes bacterium]|nr:hypothetical protein [Bacillota bacterium]
MEKRFPVVSHNCYMRAAGEYRAALREHQLAAEYKPPLTLSGRQLRRSIPRCRKTLIILLPGFNSNGQEWSLFKEALQPMARRVMAAQIDTALGNEALTDSLYQWLEGENMLKKNIPLTLIGFSNGGLIGRRLLQKYGVMNVRRLIMIATPNWGTSLAVYGQWFMNHPGLQDLKTGSAFINTLNSGCEAARAIPQHVITGSAARDVAGGFNDGVVWENSATLGYSLPYVRVETGEPVCVYPPNSAWHLNLTRRGWRPLFGPSNDKAWPVTLNYVRCFLTEY